VGLLAGASTAAHDDWRHAPHSSSHSRIAQPVTFSRLTIALAPLFAMTAHPLVRRFGKFGIVGATGVGVNTAVLWLLTHGLTLHYLVASPIAIEIALCTNYLLNNNWTFLDFRAGIVNRSGLARYHAVSLGGMAINVAILHVLVTWVGLPVIVANLAGIGVATLWNFSLSVSWTWRPAALVRTA
jgi:putative flippase GtrA